jgi:hypothetical protein
MPAFKISAGAHILALPKCLRTLPLEDNGSRLSICIY